MKYISLSFFILGVGKTSFPRLFWERGWGWTTKQFSNNNLEVKLKSNEAQLSNTTIVEVGGVTDDR